MKPENMSNPTFAEALASALKDYNITQAELVCRTGWAGSVVSRFVTGEREPRIANQIKLAEALGGRFIVDENGVRFEKK